jgi:hypothetical protein
LALRRFPRLYPCIAASTDAISCSLVCCSFIQHFLYRAISVLS